MIEIKLGDYIKSDTFSFIQGTVVGVGVIGKRIPAYRIETPHGKTELIIKGQANLWLTKEELADKTCNGWSRHD